MGASIFVYDPDGTIGMVDDSDPESPAEEFASGYGVEYYPNSIYFFAELALEPAKDEDLGFVSELNHEEYIWVLSEVGTPYGVPLRVHDAQGTLDPEAWVAAWGTRNYPDAIYFFGPEVL